MYVDVIARECTPAEAARVTQAIRDAIADRGRVKVVTGRSTKLMERLQPDPAPRDPAPMIVSVGGRSPITRIRLDAWTDEEDAVIKPCANKEAALAAYRAAFPASPHKSSAITAHWYILTAERREVPEVSVVRCPYCVATYRPRYLMTHIRNAHRDRYEEYTHLSWDEILQLGFAAASREILDDNTPERFPDPVPDPGHEVATPALQCDSDKITMPANPGTVVLMDPLQIIPGLHVRMIKPDRGLKMIGTLTVLSRKGDLIEVRNGDSKRHLIDVKCLELVPIGVKTP